MNPLWKVYKSKVLKTLNPEQEEMEEEEEVVVEEVQEVQNDVNSGQDEENPNSVAQLAKRMQGVSLRGWTKMSALFNKDDEHQLLEETESPVPDHPLAVRPEEPRQNRRSPFWDSFAANWAAKKQAEAAAAAAASVNEAGPGEEGEEVGGELNQEGQVPQDVEAGLGGGGGGGGGGGTEGGGFSKYMALGRGSEEASIKWNFVTSKLAELKTKTT